MPVKTIASPASSAAAITSSSRIEPPGWITAARSRLDRGEQPVGEGEEGVGRDRGADRPRLGPARFLGRVLGLPGGDSGRFEPVHLAGPDPGRGAVFGVDDGVRLDVLGDGPGEQAVGQLAVGRRAPGDDLEVVLRRYGHRRGSGRA